MDIITVIAVVALSGPALWAFNAYLPLARPAMNILHILAAGVLGLWLLQVFKIIAL